MVDCLASDTCHGNGVCDSLTGQCNCIEGFDNTTNCNTCTNDHYGDTCSCMCLFINCNCTTKIPFYQIVGEIHATIMANVTT